MYYNLYFNPYMYADLDRAYPPPKNESALPNSLTLIEARLQWTIIAIQNYNLDNYFQC